MPSYSIPLDATPWITSSDDCFTNYGRPIMRFRLTLHLFLDIFALVSQGAARTTTVGH